LHLDLPFGTPSAVATFQTSLPSACAAPEPESIRDGIFRKGIPASQLAAMI
jgi:hypothetical protein